MARLAHIALATPLPQRGYRWYTRVLGFRCSARLEDDWCAATREPSATAPAADAARRELGLRAAWLRCTQAFHDVALYCGGGPRVHHVAFQIPSIGEAARAVAVLARAGRIESVEYGPVRHELSQARVLYLRDPDGHRIELSVGGALLADLDAPPRRRSVDPAVRADMPSAWSIWGTPGPGTWFTEGTPVRSLDDGAFVEVAGLGPDSRRVERRS